MLSIDTPLVQCSLCSLHTLPQDTHTRGGGSGREGGERGGERGGEGGEVEERKGGQKALVSQVFVLVTEQYWDTVGRYYRFAE